MQSAVTTAQRASSRSSSRSNKHPIVASRTTTAALLTAVAVLLAIAVGVAFGPLAIALFAFSFPVALWLLWFSADTLRSDEEPREHE